MVGTKVILKVKNQTGTDAFGAPIYTETSEEVDGVLIGSPSSDDFEIYGKSVAYVLGIPKGDTHIWKDAEVEFFGDKFRTLGLPEKGIDANIPLRWNQNVRVARYEG